MTFHDAPGSSSGAVISIRSTTACTAARNTQGHAPGPLHRRQRDRGPLDLAADQGIENARGIQITRRGTRRLLQPHSRLRRRDRHVPLAPLPAIDIHNNDLSELTDDGIELDYSERNTRCFFNRLTNVFQGISMQPVYGGPVYVFRNAMDNVAVEPFKLHNSPSGVPYLPQHVGEERHPGPALDAGAGAELPDRGTISSSAPRPTTRWTHGPDGRLRL